MALIITKRKKTCKKGVTPFAAAAIAHQLAVSYLMLM